MQDSPFTHHLVLVGAGKNKIAVIKVVREFTQLGLAEAKQIVDNLPQSFHITATPAQVQDIAHALTQAGASIRIEPPEAPTPTPYASDHTAPSRYLLTLLDVGRDKIAAIKIIRDFTNLGLDKAKEIVDNLPQRFDLPTAQIQQLIQNLEQIGATVQLEAISTSPSTTASATNQRDGRYRLVLLEAGRNKIELIKELRTVFQLGLAEAKKVADSTPLTLADKLTWGQANELAQVFQAAGAVLQILSA